MVVMQVPVIPIDPRFRGVDAETRFIPCFPPGLVGGISPGLGPDRILLKGPCFVSGLAVADGFHAVYAGYAATPNYEASIDSASRDCAAILQDVIQHNRVITAMGGDVLRSDSLCEIIAVAAPGRDPRWSYSVGIASGAQTLADEFNQNGPKRGMVVTGLSGTDGGLPYVAEARLDADGGVSEDYETRAVSVGGTGLPGAAEDFSDAGFIITASTSDGNSVSPHTTFTLVGTRPKGGAAARHTRVLQIGGNNIAIADGFDAGYSLSSYMFDRNANPLPDGGIQAWWIVMQH